MNAYSISVRLRRTTTEEYYVAVPVSEAVMADEPNGDGSWSLDPAKIKAAAVELGEGADDGWVVEGREIAFHPIQKAPDQVHEHGHDHDLGHGHDHGHDHDH